LIVTDTQASRLSYIEAFLTGNADEVGVATVFVSHPWAGSFDTLVESCSRHPDDVFWIDIFCKNQWVVNSDDTATELQRCVQTCRNPVTFTPQVLFLISPWPNPIALTRIWCLFELMHALLCKAHILMSISADAQSALTAQSRAEQLSSFESAVSLSNAQATVAADVDAIMADIDSMPDGRSGMEQKLKQYLRSCLWVYLHAESALQPAPEPELEPESEPPIGAETEPEPEPEIRAELDSRLCGVAEEIGTHLAWLQHLADKTSGESPMTDDEQDSAEQRTLRLQTIHAQSCRHLAAEQVHMLMDALALCERLGLIESDSDGEIDEQTGELPGVDALDLDHAVAAQLHRELSNSTAEEGVPPEDAPDA
jgi:hypothetical protein